VKKLCVLEEDKFCDGCGKCDVCDLDPSKICDNCMKCLEGGDEKGYRVMPLGELQMEGDEYDAWLESEGPECDCDDDCGCGCEHDHGHDCDCGHDHDCDCGGDCDCGHDHHH